jgi:cytochrome c-type biogenesis protein CcmF
MISAFGQLSLCLAILAAAGAVLAAVAAIRFQAPQYNRITRWMLGIIAASFTVASVALVVALVNNDFRFTYVAGYTDIKLPIGYRLAAFWAGQEGSLLLWAWLLGILCLMAAWGYRRLETPEIAIANAAMAVVCGVFAGLLLFAANPFRMFQGIAPPDGRGLNPMLQDPAMLAHPPLLFLGYAGFTIPFAVLIGVLIAGRSDNRWLTLIRRWTLVSWIFLGAGIIVGGWWAYIELGWGGYWAWDPVENASLLPWLTATALMHSIMVQQRRGMFKFWNAALISLTFILCIFGTYLTRSGIVDSVHTFAGSPLASCFLVFIVICAAFSIGLVAWRWRLLKSEHQLEAMISREGAFLLANILLVAMMLITLAGTIFPVLSGPFLREAASAKPEFYNATVAPLIVLLVAVMALGPILVFGANAPRAIVRSLIIPGIGALVVAIITVAMGIHNFWAVLVAAIAALGTLAVIAGFVRAVSARQRSTGEKWAVSALTLIDRDHRRYGGQLAHLGVMMMVIGVAGSSLYDSDVVHRLRPGESVQVGRYSLTFVKLEEVKRSNYTTIQANVRVSDPRGQASMLHPERRFYRNWEDKPQSQVAISTNWREDLYIALAGWEDSGALTALQIKINPLVLWLWIGSIVMGIGALYAMVPSLLPMARRALVPAARQPELEPVLTYAQGAANGRAMPAAPALTAHLETKATA